MKRLDGRGAADRIGMGMSRAVVDTINDSPFMQTMGAKIMSGESSTDIEHWHPFGSTAFPMGKTTDEQAQGGMMKGAAEVLISTLMGNRSHPIAQPAADRRFRPNGMQAGENTLHDAFKQFLHFSKDAAVLESPKSFVHRVAKDKQQQSGQSGGSGAGGSSEQSSGGQQKNSGASLRGEKDVKVSVEAKEDGTYTVTAEGAGTMTFKSLVIKAGGVTLTMKDNKFLLDGEVHLGGNGGQLLHRKGDLDSDGDAAVGSATKVYAI